MRQRTTGLVALGAGVFFLVLAVLLRFYAVPTLEVIPQDYWTHYTATGTGSAFSPQSLKTEDNLELTQDITIKGNLHPNPPAPNDSVVWDYASELAFKTSSPCAEKVFIKNQCGISFSNESVAFDKHTAEVKPGWAGDKVDDGATQDGGAKQVHSGYISKFDFNLSKKDIPMWDSVSGTAQPAKYVGTEKVNQLTVYKFVQTIGTADKPLHIYDSSKIPAALVGDVAVDGKNTPVYEYSVTTALIDPVSGIPVAGDQQVRLTAGSQDGTDTNRLTLLNVDLKLDGVQVTDTNGVPKFNGDTPVWSDHGYTAQAVRDAKAADRITLIKNTLPLISLILGLVLLAAGIFLTLRGGTAAAGTGAGSTGGVAPITEEREEEKASEEEPTKVIPAVAPEKKPLESSATEEA